MKNIVIEFFKALIDLLDVKSIVTLTVISCLVYCTVEKLIDPSVFVGMCSSIITYYFNRKESPTTDVGESDS